MNTISVQRGPRPSNQSCGLPSIWISSPNRGRRAIETPGWAAAASASHKPSRIWSRRTVSRETKIPSSSANFSHASVGPKSRYLPPSSSLVRPPTLRREPTVRGPPALARHKPCVALGAIGPTKPLDLPNANPKSIRRRALAEDPAADLRNHNKLFALPTAHRQCPRRHHSPAQSRGDIFTLR